MTTATGRHRSRARRRAKTPDGPAFASSPATRAVRFALCVASLLGLAYATVVVLGLLGPSESEKLGLPSRHPSETTAPLGAPGRPLSVETENYAHETTASPTPTATASPSASPGTAEAGPSESAAAEDPSQAPADEEAAPADESPAAEDPADDSGSGNEDSDDKSGKLIDVNLLGIHIAI